MIRKSDLYDFIGGIFFNMEQEIWKDIPDYEGLYQCSDLGRVKSIGNKKSRKEKILKQGLSSNGYFTVNLCKNGISKNNCIHKLIAMSFLGHNPNKYTNVIDHINNIKSDNSVENLQIVTTRENISKRFTKKKGSSYTGVRQCIKTKKWRSSIWYDGHSIDLGYFNSEIDAHIAYEKKKNLLQKI